MEKARFDELNKQLPTNLRIRLDRIKRYLSQNMASVMVGAGFSLNAKKLNPTSSMKSWNGLVSSFWDLLHPGEPKKFDFVTPMHLASQIEALSGRTELDQQIANSLPDNDLAPGDLHIALMKLPWKDVFTTNYDRLLERAGEMTDRKYNLVTNKATLMYTLSPRIIKLHGSFPDITPFIMTEDDFRTYPDKYPEFVNTVRQSLIENVFCLLGFSGEDPNFLSWLGWLRDVMGSLISPVYLIDYREHVDDADAKLNNLRKVDIVNLAEIPEIRGRQESLSFFFQYLQEDTDKSEDWVATLGPMAYSTKTTLTELTAQMEAIRNSYPGWLFLPVKYYSHFRDLDEFPYLEQRLEDLNNEELINFLYEIDWRLSISCTPNMTKWYKDTLEKLDLKNAPKALEWKVLSLKLSLLCMYRHVLDKENYEKLEKHLEKYFMTHESDLIGRFYYNRCLYWCYKLDFKKVQSILSEWYVSDVDYQGLLWKASIWNEIGVFEKSLNLLDLVSKNAYSALLKNSENKPFLNSCIHIAYTVMQFNIQRMFSTRVNHDNDDSLDFDALLDTIRLRAESGKNHGGTFNEHGYLLKDVNMVWCGDGRGYYRDYLNAYRIILLMERTGHPFQMFGRSLKDNLMETTLSILTKYDSVIVISSLLRMNCHPVLFRKIFTRELANFVTAEEAKSMYADWYPICKKAILSGDKDSYLSSLVYDVALPVLISMSVKLGMDEIVTLFNLYISVYTKGHHSYSEKYPILLYACMDEKSQESIISEAYKVPLKPISRVHDSFFPMPTKGYSKYNVETEAISILIKGFENSDIQVNRYAYKRTVALHRQLGNGWMTDELKAAIYRWRSSKPSVVESRKSFSLLPYNDTLDEFSPEQLLYQDVQRLKLLKFKKETFKQTLFDFRGCVEILIENTHPWDTCLIDILSKVNDFLRVYEKNLLSATKLDFMGDFSFSQYLFVLLAKLFQRANLASIETTIKQELLGRFKKQQTMYDCVSIQSVLMLSIPSTDDEIKEFANILVSRLFNTDKSKRHDAIRTLINLVNGDKEVSGLINFIMLYLSSSQSDFNYEYLDFFISIKDKLNNEQINQLAKTLKQLLHQLKGITISRNGKMDITYSALQLMNCLNNNANIKAVYKLWKKEVVNPEEFNDVKVLLL